MLRLYRYRNAEQMLKFKEIEKKNMFFPASSMQNDPMEGISDIVWNGDYIAWENLFKNYCMNLTQAILVHRIAAFSDDGECYNTIKVIKSGFIRGNSHYYKLCQAASQFVANES